MIRADRALFQPRRELRALPPELSRARPSICSPRRCGLSRGGGGGGPRLGHRHPDASCCWHAARRSSRVEPNDAMRAAAEARLGAAGALSQRRRQRGGDHAAPRPASICWSPGRRFTGSTSQRGAPRGAARACGAGGFGALLWNERPREAGDFLADYEALLLRHAAEYARDHRQPRRRGEHARVLRRRHGARHLPQPADLDFEGLKGRLMSSSYAPEPGHPQHEPMLAGLREVFRRHEHGTARSCSPTARSCTSASCAPLRPLPDARTRSAGAR